MSRPLAGLSLLFALAGCAGSDTISTALPPNYLADAPRLVAEADWNSAETVSVRLTDFAYSPAEITLHRNKPVRLVLVNTTDTDHAIEADQFFREIATRQIVGPGGANAAPWVSRVAVPAGQTKELWLVPARYGAYAFRCGVTGHAALGEKGLINVVP